VLSEWHQRVSVCRGHTRRSPGAFEDIIDGNHLAAHRKPHLARSSQDGAAGTWIAAAAGSHRPRSTSATKHLGNEAPRQRSTFGKGAASAPMQFANDAASMTKPRQRSRTCPDAHVHVAREPSLRSRLARERRLRQRRCANEAVRPCSRKRSGLVRAEPAETARVLCHSARAATVSLIGYMKGSCTPPESAVLQSPSTVTPTQSPSGPDYRPSAYIAGLAPRSTMAQSAHPSNRTTKNATHARTIADASPRLGERTKQQAQRLLDRGWAPYPFTEGVICRKGTRRPTAKGQCAGTSLAGYAQADRNSREGLIQVSPRQIRSARRLLG
jgi:hypothetical protein